MYPTAGIVASADHFVATRKFLEMSITALLMQSKLANTVVRLS
jgi:hypothetical protein